MSTVTIYAIIVSCGCGMAAMGILLSWFAGGGIRNFGKAVLALLIVCGIAIPVMAIRDNVARAAYCADSHAFGSLSDRGC